MNEEHRAFIGAQTPLETIWGPVTAEAAELTPATDGDLVIHIGDALASERPLIRIHSACIFSEVFGHDFCDCYEQLDLAMQSITAAGSGLLFYLRFDGRGSGLSAKVAATALELEGMDTFESRRKLGLPADGRDFAMVATWLRRRGVDAVTLLSNNPEKSEALKAEGIDVVPETLLVRSPNPDVARLYRTKAERFGHTIPPELYETEHGQLTMFDPSPERQSDASDHVARNRDRADPTSPA